MDKRLKPIDKQYYELRLTGVPVETYRSLLMAQHKLQERFIGRKRVNLTEGLAFLAKEYEDLVKMRDNIVKMRDELTQAWETYKEKQKQCDICGGELPIPRCKSCG